MIKKQQQSNEMLIGDNALDSGIKQAWEQDNQAWWDWYVTLADNSDQPDNKNLVQLPPIKNTHILSNANIEEELSTPYNVTKNHSKDFWKNLEKICENTKLHRKELRDGYRIG